MRSGRGAMAHALQLGPLISTRRQLMGTLSKRGIDELTATGSSIDEASSNFGRTLEEAGPAAVAAAAREPQLVDAGGRTLGTAKYPRGSIDVSDQSDLERVIAGANIEAKRRPLAQGTTSPPTDRTTISQQAE